MNWADYWNQDTTLYANERHKQVHFAGIARDLIRCIRSPDARVVDYGCGEALSADLVAAACGHLYLCDSASRTRERLTARFGTMPNISVISPEAFDALPAGSVDLIVANSVVQYLSAEQFAAFLATARAKLAPGGDLVLGDIIPRNVGPLTDAFQLLRFGWGNGFFLAACFGLVRSFFSSYRKMRAKLGLLQLDQQQVIDMLASAGFSARNHLPNLGHNSARMTLIARVAP
ncbi:MAG TPA: class I SAM-dependent methyltransferase [Hyphomicrobiaceae bacterium]|jgi:SAM-dependent methyltransferase|nr:class I SAM-dependent methyltransferase [Hyphomicrobiaceae bacterium]